MYRKLKDIDVSELSLVRKGANKKKYVIMKNDGTTVELEKDDVAISISSDGTVKGTVVRINNSEISNVRDFNFGFYAPSGGENVENGWVNKVDLSYTLDTGVVGGFKQSSNYRLVKNNGEVSNVLDKAKLNGMLKEYLGEEVKLEEVKKSEEELASVEKSLNTVNEYKEEFPPELKDAIGIIAKHACGSFGVEKADEKKPVIDKEDIEKAGKKHSKKTLEVINDIVAKLHGLLSDEPEKVEEVVQKGKEEDTKYVDVMKKLEDVNVLLKKKEEESKALETRLAEVEKVKGVKKGLDGQDDDDELGSKKDVKKSEVFPWNSFKARGGE
jgi:hypothetical protein